MQGIIVIAFFLEASLGQPIVDGSIGTIEGIVEQVLDTHIESFLGIPYAKPPVGKLRFALPEAFGPVGDLKATEYSPPCQQVPDPTTPLGDKPPNEDCLYLNVFRKQGTSKNDKKAVMAIIHGGGFIVGGTAAPFENAAPLAGIGDVIIVSMNYRLGIFGFADMKEFAPGNLGLRDQRMALQWIQDHIADFGGDPDRVTVMGVSAGSMSIAAQIMTPIDNKTLFRSVIMDAGVVLSNGFHEDTESSYTRLKKIAQQLGCPVNSKAMVECLRETSVEDLLPLAVNTTGTTEITSFVATIDGSFIPNDVEDYVNTHSDKVRKLRTMIGYALNEGTFFMGRTFLTFNYPNPTTKEETLEYCKKLSDWYNYRLDLDNKETEALIRKLYVDRYTPYNAVAAFQSDGIFKCPVNSFIQSYSKVNDAIYVYQFNRKLKETYAGLFDPTVLGAFHYSPYLHFSGAWFKNTAFINPVDAQFSLETMKLVSGFAKGDETLVFRGMTWPSFTNSGKVFIFDETPRLQEGQPSALSCQELFSAAMPSCKKKSSLDTCFGKSG